MSRVSKIQLILFFIAVFSGACSFYLGDKMTNTVAYDSLSQNQIALESGWIGGAIGMGLISASCILGFVQLEISKNK